MSISKMFFILLRAASSASSSSRVAAPKAEDSNIPVKPEPNPLAMFSIKLESEFLTTLTFERLSSSFSRLILSRLPSLNLFISASTRGELGSNSSGIFFTVNPS